MNHLSEEQLILFHYDEAEERSSFEDHLAGCTQCRAQFEELERDLAVFSSSPMPERPDDYGHRVWLRLRPRLMERPGLAWSWLFAPPRWLPASVLALFIIGAFLVGRYSRPPAQAIPPQARERILLMAVGNHLERSQMVLVELENTEATGRVDIFTERNIARDLVDENRLYRETAAQEGDPGVASVLDDLERVLLEIANGPATVSNAQLDEIRHRIEAKGILFKIRVIGSQVEQRERSAARQTTGGAT